MVYSTYSLLIHVGFIPHPHNWFLHLWLEGGLLGIISLAWMAGAAAWLAFKDPRQRRYASAAGWAFVVLLLHGLVDSPLYGTRPTPLLFLPLGLLLAGRTWRPERDKAQRRESRKPSILSLAILSLLLAAALIWRRPALATLYANLGALAQTRTELAVYSWPQWPLQDAVRREVDLSPAVTAFHRALAYDPANATANRRLGMIALSLGDYPAALEHLQVAYDATPWDNATRQLLGEAYLVNGRQEKGEALWATVRNDQGQLAARIFWYQHIGDPGRAASLRQAAASIP